MGIEWRRLGVARGPVLLGLTMLAGCTVGPNFKPPHARAPASLTGLAAPATPAKDASIATAAPIEAAWWRSFHDPILTGLEKRAAAANLDLRLASIRLAESRAEAGIVGAAQYPQLGAAASYTREKPSSKGIFSALSGSQPTSSTNAASVANGGGGLAGGLPGSSLQPFDLYGAGGDASWEIDLWGKVRREVESANATVQASLEARRAAMVSVLAEVARDYIQLRGVQRTIAITTSNLRTDQDSLHLTQARFADGLATNLDVANARAQVALVAAQLPSLEQQQNLLINQLSLLLGAEPGALRAELITAKPVPPTPPHVPVGLPSDLLLRRPDILQAQAQLHAATANIGVAVAAFYPQISISGSLSLSSLQPSTFATWAARQYAIGPVLTLPIFDGGRISGTVKLRKVQQQEAAITYQKTVLQAWHEVANALDAYNAAQNRRDTLRGAVGAARQALSLARQRYKQGISDFLEVLDAERSMLAAEQQYADATTIVSTDLVSLYKALGGGWNAAGLSAS